MKLSNKVTETIIARHSGIRVISISAITNMAVGISKTPLSHEEVLAEGQRMLPKFKSLVEGIIQNI